MTDKLDSYLGLYEVIATDTRDHGDHVFFKGIDEPVFMVAGNPWPVTENEYVVMIERDRDGDLVLMDCRPARQEHGA